jgi:hypothetical protein
VPALTRFAMAMQQQLLDANASARAKVDRHRPRTQSRFASRADEINDTESFGKSSWAPSSSSQQEQVSIETGQCVCSWFNSQNAYDYVHVYVYVYVYIYVYFHVCSHAHARPGSS